MSRFLALLLIAACSGGKDDDPTDPDTDAEDSEDTPDDSEDTPEDSEDTPEDSEDTPEDTDDAPEDTEDTDVVAGPDADSDGSPDAADCDDANPNIAPGLPELCNGGTDDDCDPTTQDAGTATFFPTSGAPVSLNEALTAGGSAEVAGSGEIVLCSGTFRGNVNATSAALTVRGAGAAFTTWQNSGPPAIYAKYAGSTLNVQGITFTGGQAINTSGNVTDLQISDAAFRSMPGATAILTGHVRATVTDSVFEDADSAITYTTARSGDYGSLSVSRTTFRRITGSYGVGPDPQTDTTFSDVVAETANGLRMGGVARATNVQISGYGLINQGSSLTLTNGTFTGGGINSTDPMSAVTVNQASFTDCQTVATAKTFTGNDLTVLRSGMIAASGQLRVDNATFTDPTASSFSLTCPDGPTTSSITDSVIEGTTSIAIQFACPSSTLLLTGTTLRDNARSFGALVTLSSNTTLEGGVFEDNDGSVQGSIIGASDNSILRGVVLRRNQSHVGAVTGSVTVLSVEDSTFEDNTAVGEWGAINTQGPLVVRRSTFSGNHGNLYGAVRSVTGTLELTDSTFIRNDSGLADNMGIYFGDVAVITRTTFGDDVSENGTWDIRGGGAAYGWDLDGLWSGSCTSAGCTPTP